MVGFEGAFDNWAQWCTATPTCEFTAADVGARWDALKQQLDATPIAGPDGRLANNATMQRATQAALYSESEWPVLARALANAEAGDPAALFDGRLVQRSQRGRNVQHPVPVVPGHPVREWDGSTPPDDPEALAQTLREAAPRFGQGITAQDVTQEVDRCKQLVGDVEPTALSYAGDGPIVRGRRHQRPGDTDPLGARRWSASSDRMRGMVTYTGEGHGQLLVSTCVTSIEAALLADLTLPDPDTICDPDPIVEKPSWWDGLPVPEGVSEVAKLPTLAAVLGASPTLVFSEMRTTSLSAIEAVAAYTAALNDAGLDQFDSPSIIPIDDVAQGTYSDFGDRTIVVLALGPTAFDDEALQSAKTEIPPDTTVVWLVAIDRLGNRAKARRLEPQRLPQFGPQTIRTGRLQLIGDDDPLDHVADDRRPRPALQLDGNHGTVRTCDAAIDRRRRSVAGTGSRGRSSPDDEPRVRWCGRRGQSRERCC